MRSTSNRITALLILVGLVAPAAWAHPGNGGGGFAVGLAHPFAGIDHLLVLIAVGTCACRALSAQALRWAGTGIAATGALMWVVGS